VLDGEGWYFSTPDDAGRAFEEAESDAAGTLERGVTAQQRAREAFRWEDVADAYEKLARSLSERKSVHRAARRARRSSREW
jgi:glycosyltransferase involved in cell wall biosynthesis